MSLYERYVLPHVINIACGTQVVQELRQKVVPRARGQVLEVGLGTGINLPLYKPENVEFVWGLEPSLGMREKAAKRAQAAPFAVRWLDLPGEAIPLPDASVDVIISNCVINLSGDKSKVITEAFRVLKPGGRLAVSDIVIRGEVPSEVRSCVELWVGCVAGALTEDEFLGLLHQAGFEDASIEPTRIYEFEDAKAFLSGAGLDTEVLAREVSGRVMGAFVRARKP